ncbi:MAG TPA: RDD family protein [Geopsychrobacteraceae bacterium]|jgi:predicted Zn finger-like uncharacterized protein
MLLTCPHCRFSRQVDAATLPPRVNKATCPRCRQSFALPRPDPAEALVAEAPPETGQADRTGAARRLPKAGFWIRLVAALLDGFAILFLQGLLGGLLLLVGVLNGTADEGLGLLVQLFTYLLGCVYYVFFTGYCGQTPGKMAVRIKVIRCDGAPLSYPRAALREIPAKFISGLIFGIGYLMIAFDEQKQGLHDRMVDTYVIKL